MFRELSLAVSAVVVLSVAGCAGASSAAPPTPVVSSPSPSPSMPAAPAPTPTAVKGATWGDTVTLPSGLAFTVAYEGVRPATEYTDGGKLSGKTAVFKTTLKNGTTQPVPTTQWVLMRPTLTAGPDGHQAVGNSWDGRTAPQAPTLQPGETTTWEWGVDDAPANVKGLRVEYTVPAYLGGSPVVWRGDVP